MAEMAHTHRWRSVALAFSSRDVRELLERGVRHLAVYDVQHDAVQRETP